MLPAVRGERSSFRTVERPAPVSAQVAQQILDAILSGELEVGQRLPSEQQLAQELGVSRPSVREALAALQFAGHVESRRGAGTVVVAREPSISSVLDHPALASADDVVDLLEARLVLEPQIVAVAATDPDPAALDAAREVVDGMQLVAAEPDLHAVSDARAHAALIETCRNPFLVREGKRLLDAASGPHWEEARAHAWSGRELPRLWARQHAAVCAAIAAGRPKDAERASRAHIVSVIANALEWGQLESRENRRLETLIQQAERGS